MFYIYTAELSGRQFIVEPHTDGSYTIHPMSYEPYNTWLAEGNTPEEWSANAD